MTITPDEIARLREKLAKATPGPWARNGARQKLGDESCIVVSADSEQAGIAFLPIGSQQRDKFFQAAFADAGLIAAAVNTLPSLLDAAERVAALEAENARLREALDPFGPINETIEHALWGALPDSATVNMTVCLGDLRRARAALKGEV